MQFKVFEIGVEVNGTTVNSVMDGLGTYKTLARNYLIAAGIGKIANAEYQIDLEGWYSQEGWLRAFSQIAAEIGDLPLKQIGMKIPENAKFPPWVKDIDSAIKSIDIAYHMNHRLNGKILFDPANGTMQEGIGHYGYERAAGKNLIISECRNPYPCSFDLGIIITMAAKFGKGAKVTHDNSKPCRKKGAESCTYLITW